VENKEFTVETDLKMKRDFIVNFV